jgi:hypothetical protein
MSSVLGGFAGFGGGGSIARASVDLVLNAGAFQAQLDEAEAKTKASTASMSKGFAGFQEQIRKSFSTAQLAVVGFGAVAAVGIGKAVGATQEWAAEVRTLQRVTGDSAENTSKLAAAGNLLNLSTEKLNTGFGILDKNIINNSANLTKYGVRLTDAQGNTLPFLDILGNLSDKFATLQAGPEQAAFAMNVFGRSGKELIPILSRGSAGLQDLYEKAQEAGLVMSQETLDASKELGIAGRELGDAMKGAGIEIGTDFLPVMTVAAHILTDVVELVHKVPTPVITMGAAFVTLAGGVIVAQKAFIALKGSITENIGTIGKFAEVFAIFTIGSGIVQNLTHDFTELAKQTGLSADVLAFLQDRLSHRTDSGFTDNVKSFIGTLNGVNDQLDSLTGKLQPTIDQLGKMGFTSEAASALVGNFGSDLDGTAKSADYMVSSIQGAVPVIQGLTDDFVHGKISLSQFTKDMGQFGISASDSARIANAALDDVGQHLDKAGQKVRNFAGLTQSQLADFRHSMVSQIRDTFGTIDSIGQKWTVSGGKVESGTQKMLASIQRYNADLTKLNKLHVGDAVVQFLQQQGPGAIDGFVHANANMRAQIVSNAKQWNAAFDQSKHKVDALTAGAKNANAALNDLNGKSITITVGVDSSGMNQQIAAAVARALSRGQG